MKSRRHAKILELIRELDLETQDELLRYLREAGFDVTQATVSRDIRELRLIKIQSGSGRYKYSIGTDSQPDMASKFYDFFTDAALSAETAGNLLVIKCMSGMAQAVCAAMDAMVWEDFVGTLAGEDTIFVACRTESAAKAAQEELKKLLKGS